MNQNKEHRYFYHPYKGGYLEHYMVVNTEGWVVDLWVNYKVFNFKDRYIGNWQRITGSEIASDNVNNKSLAVELTEKEFKKRIFQVML